MMGKFIEIYGMIDKSMLGFSLLIDNLDIHVFLHRIADDVELPLIDLHLHVLLGEEFASAFDEL
jgi:hypothetical protein